MFGIGDFFVLLIGGGVLASKSFKSSNEKLDNQVRIELEHRFIERYTDPELEKSSLQDILNPKKYDEVWERIEKYKVDNGPVYIDNAKNPYSPWNQYAGVKRLQFLNANGSTSGKTQAETDRLLHNRGVALSMLMHTYGKMSEYNAKQIARRATTSELSLWLKDGWPRIVDIYNITLDDLRNDIKTSPQKLISPWRVLVMILVCVLLLYLVAIGKDSVDPAIGLIAGLGGLVALVYMVVSWINR